MRHGVTCNFLLTCLLCWPILYLIIGHVHDKPSLNSCALTSSCLRAQSQCCLFSSFRICLAIPSRGPTTSYCSSHDLLDVRWNFCNDIHSLLDCALVE